MTYFLAKVFNSDISKWDVSSATDINGMFYNSKAFNGDISKWDVKSVEFMKGMFHQAAVFNGDLSKWDVPSVTDMNSMFSCRDAWTHSKASKAEMFAGSPGSISRTVCTTTFGVFAGIQSGP